MTSTLDEPTTAAPVVGGPKVSSIGGPTAILTEDEIRAFVAESLATIDVDGKSVCLVVPDGTRSCPLPLLINAVYGALHGRVTELTVLIALGTHAAMSDSYLAKHLGYEEGELESTYPGLVVRNHEWWDPSRLTSVGTIEAATVRELSDGRLDQSIEVVINRAVVDHDVALVIGPVFPHEVVGFSGGNKYFFPGVAGQEVIDFSHWLGALITSSSIIGTKGITPVRALINAAAALIPSERLALCLVAQSGTKELHAASFGTPEDAWSACADIAAETHVRYLDKPVKRVLSILPPKYDDMWTGAKGFYKVEPVVAEGGQVIIYAPFITQVSAMHPSIEEVGYHVRDYFLKQWDRFKEHHWGDLAHSTHLRGAGTYDADSDTEVGRVTVTLATGIPRETVEKVNLDYLDPDEVDIATYEADPETLVIHQAGEVLYRLR
jgi:lactate racemase